MQDYPKISIVVIGFNEAENLESTFTALKNMNYPAQLVELIYVDSGSSDGSVDIAKKYCDKVFIEPVWPTAARNRNRGLIESSNEICHFLDGDIIIDPDYLTAAVNKLSEGDVQAVFGYLDEKCNKGLSRILLHDYRNRKPGYIDSPGAGGTFIRDSLIEVNGWDERIPRGEEMELGDRYRNAGYKIWYLDCKMGIHDFGITNIFMYLKKQVKEGISIGKVTSNPSNDKFFQHIRKLASRNILFHILILAIFTGSFLTSNQWFIPGSFILYLIYLFVKYRVIRKISNKDTIYYHFIQNLTKTCELFGFIKFHLQFYKTSDSNKVSFFKRLDIKEVIREKTTQSNML
ncbi:Glycosyl transferase family 2 [anaerobic digester metagenome]